MTGLINTALRGLCLLAYVAALAHLAGWLPAAWLSRAPLLAAVLLVVHTAELPFALKHLRRDHRPLAQGLLLTLLFGVLHWLPLARREPAAVGSDRTR